MEKLIRYFQFIRYNHYIKDAVILVSGNGLKIFLGFISNVILAKFFGAENLAIYGTLIAVSLLCVNFTDFGYGNTLNQLTHRHHNRQKEIFSNIFILKITFLIIFLIIFYGLIDKITQVLTSLEGRAGLLKILLLSIAGESLFRFLLSSLQAKHNFKRFSLLLIINNAIRVAGIIFLYVFKLLTLESFFILVACSFALLLLTNWQGWKLTLRLNFSLIKKISRFAIWVWLFIIFNTIFVKSDILLINYLKYDRAIIGNYVLIFFFISLISLFQDAIFTQLLPKTSEFSSKIDYQKYYADIKYIRIAAVMLSFIYVIVLPLILKWIYADQYEINYPSIYLLGTPFLFSLFNEFNGVLLYSIEKHRYISVANVLGLIFISISLLMFRSMTTVFHVVVAVAIGKLVVEAFIYLKVKQCLQSVPE